MVDAILSDEQIAEHLADEPAKARERISDWSPLREGLARVEDAVRGLTAVTVAAAGGKAPKLKAASRPRTAVTAIRERRRQEQHERLVKKLIRR